MQSLFFLDANSRPNGDSRGSGRYFAIFAGFILKEKPRDEREAWHRMYADRIAFLVGTAILLVAIAVQGLGYVLDPGLSMFWEP